MTLSDVNDILNSLLNFLVALVTAATPLAIAIINARSSRRRWGRRRNLQDDVESPEHNAHDVEGSDHTVICGTNSEMMDCGRSTSLHELKDDEGHGGDDYPGG